MPSQEKVNADLELHKEQEFKLEFLMKLVVDDECKLNGWKKCEYLPELFNKVKTECGFAEWVRVMDVMETAVTMQSEQVYPAYHTD